MKCAHEFSWYVDGKKKNETYLYGAVKYITVPPTQSRKNDNNFWDLLLFRVLIRINNIEASVQNRKNEASRGGAF